MNEVKQFIIRVRVFFDYWLRPAGFGAESWHITVREAWRIAGALTRDLSGGR